MKQNPWELTIIKLPIIIFRQPKYPMSYWPPANTCQRAKTKITSHSNLPAKRNVNIRNPDKQTDISSVTLPEQQMALAQRTAEFVCALS